MSTEANNTRAVDLTLGQVDTTAINLARISGAALGVAVGGSVPNAVGGGAMRGPGLQSSTATR